MKSPSNRNLLLQYAGLAFQLIAMLALMVYVGYWMDKKTQIPFPLFVWLLPIIAIIAMMIKVIKDTSKK